MIRPVALARALVLLCTLFLLGGCAAEGAVRSDLTAAAADLRADLAAPSRLAAAALLIHARTGAFPDTPFALLGSREAAAVGLADVPLSALDLDATDDGVRIAFTRLPTPAEPDDRGGTLNVAPDSGGYRVAVALDRREDPDFGGAARPLARRGPYAVVRAQSTFWASAEGVSERAGGAAEPPSRDGKRMRVHFEPLVSVPPPLRDGLTVVLDE